MDLRTEVFRRPQWEFLYILTVIVDDGDLCDGPPADNTVLILVLHADSDEEHLVRLPFVVVHDLDLDVFGRLAWLKHQRFFVRDVVGFCLRCSIKSLNPANQMTNLSTEE